MTAPKEVAPNSALDWEQSQVASVANGSRLLGASMLDKLTAEQLETLARYKGVMYVKRLHTGTDYVEVVWALSEATLLDYAQIQRNAGDGTRTLASYWDAAGKLFGYSAKDIDGFKSWIQSEPCPCPCVQCRPDLFFK